MDVTDRKAMDEHMRDSHRLQSAGQLAGGIAHEANNQMSVVLGAAHFLLRRTDLPDSARHDIDLIRQAADRTATITQQLLAFSRRQIMQLQQVDLNTVVTTIVPVLRRTLRENQDLILQLGAVTSPIRADPRQLEQVLLNLVLNARDAMPDGGLVTLSTREADIRPGEGRRDRGSPSPGRYAVLCVEDTGLGMDRATAQRAFEPFFSTKDIGQGTGLGLSVVHGIVSQTGGSIRVETEPGRGARFELCFPVDTAPAESTGSGEKAILAPPPGVVALVVEDDALVRRMSARALEEAGYSTLEAEDGQAALEQIRRGLGAGRRRNH